MGHDTKSTHKARLGKLALGAPGHSVPVAKLVPLDVQPVAPPVKPPRADLLSSPATRNPAAVFRALPRGVRRLISLVLSSGYLLTALAVCLVVSISWVSYMLIHTKLTAHRPLVPTAPQAKQVQPARPTAASPSALQPVVTPTPRPTPPAASPAPAPLPSLPAVTGKNTSYDLGVLVIKYFPLTGNGQSIDISVTGDVGGSYAAVRQHTTDVTNNLLTTYLPKAATYLGYKYGGNSPALTYHVVATLEHTVAVPINPTIHSGYPTYPDYYGIMSTHNICSYVDGQSVQEVFLWAYQGPNKPHTNQPYLGIEESKMSGPHGDISNSYEWNDMPVCKHTYVVYTFNYGRGTAEAMHSWGHQIEAEIKAVDAKLFALFQGQSYPQTLGITGRCGSVHNPPNARYEYDWANPTPQKADCEDWRPDGVGNTSNISCALWGCTDISDTNNAQLNWQVWMWQNLPGRNNIKTYQGKQLRNWWDIHGAFDAVMGTSRQLTL